MFFQSQSQNPLKKIIYLSYVLAIGFLMIVIGCALYGNWLPILNGLLFAISHLPIIATKSLTSHYDDLLSDNINYTLDFGRFLSAFLLTTSFVLPIVLHHCHILAAPAMWLTIVGGFIVYMTIVTFNMFFDSNEENEEF